MFQVHDPTRNIIKNGGWEHVTLGPGDLTNPKQKIRKDSSVVGKDFDRGVGPNMKVEDSKIA